jgi:hypothetical protein
MPPTETVMKYKLKGKRDFAEAKNQLARKSQDARCNVLEFRNV